MMNQNNQNIYHFFISTLFDIKFIDKMNVDLTLLQFKINKPEESRRDNQQNLPIFYQPEQQSRNVRVKANALFDKKQKGKGVGQAGDLLEMKFDSFQFQDKLFWDHGPQGWKMVEKQLSGDHGSTIVKHKCDSDQNSLIMDDLCRTVGNSAIGIKTIQEMDLYEGETFSNKHLFYESEDQCNGIKEFYYNLAEEKGAKTQQPLKQEIKKIIYTFVDELQIEQESSIDPQFILKLTKILKQIKKDKNSPSLKRGDQPSLARGDQPRKWGKNQPTTSTVKQKVINRSVLSNLVFQKSLNSNSSNGNAKKNSKTHKMHGQKNSYSNGKQNVRCLSPGISRQKDGKKDRASRENQKGKKKWAV